MDYFREFLGLNPWPVQEEIARAVHEPPYKVIVRSGHKVGKSFIGGALISYWYDCFDPSAVLSTAPRYEHVCGVLWREVRVQRGARNLGGFIGAAAPELRSSASHYAKGVTANKGESLQGRHQERMLFLFDEGVGVPAVYYDTARGMFKPDGRHAWVVFCNPTDTSSHLYQEEQTGQWRVIQMSALDHPNVAAELNGQPAPYPSAVSATQIDEWVKEWCESVPAADATASDFEWRGKWHRPGPNGEARILGRWPSQAVAAVWSPELWRRAAETRLNLEPHWPLVIGCDVARFGDDDTAFLLRRGPCALHAECHNGWSTAASAVRLKALCEQFRPPWQQARQVPCMIDEGGLGAGVVDQAGGYLFHGVSSAQKAFEEARFPNRRSELWFGTADLARAGLVDLSRLPGDVREQLRRQLLAPKYTLDAKGRSVVEPKDKTKETLRRSPDLADSFNLAYLVPPIAEKVVGRLT